MGSVRRDILFFAVCAAIAKEQALQLHTATVTKLAFRTFDLWQGTDRLLGGVKSSSAALAGTSLVDQVRLWGVFLV